MAPEAHGAQVLPDPDLCSKMCSAVLNHGCSSTFVFIYFLPIVMVEAAEPPRPHLGSPGPGFIVRAMYRRLKPGYVLLLGRCAAAIAL
jgi:hypothetical protein